MDITSFDLQGLQQLHSAFQNVLDSHIKQLEQLDKSEANASAIDLLEGKIHSFSTTIEGVELRINQLNDEKLRFSVEYIFWNFGLFNKSFQVTFVTTSKAYGLYGSYVTGSALYEVAEKKELVERYKAGQWNDGYIRFNPSIGDLTDDHKEILKKKGFLASEIDSISFI
ncbi:hypothetical protein [Pedobacter frigoris]|uniref:hypothetical protein n=1 Tax=Pedobacter frigoris TaxID=2571272 RepID=UPI00293114B3|nr:hypothetical protein [Pedobacter frigoris]